MRGTIRHLEFRNLAAILLCCGLAVFIGFMLTGQYLFHNEMENDRVKHLEQDLETRVTAINHFFSERFADLEGLGASRELTAFFENQALGMSMKYGLGSSLYVASRKFSQLREARRVGQDPIYQRLFFILKTGEVLIDTLRTPDHFPLFLAHLLGPGEKPRQVLGTGTEMAVSFPFYFKGEYAGQILGQLYLETIDRNLVHHTGDSGRLFFMASGEGPVFLPVEALGWPKGQDRIEVGQIPDTHPGMLRPRQGREVGILALRSKVQDLPVSIIGLSQAEAMSVSAIIAIMAAVVIFLAVTIFFIWRTATAQLIFGVRLNESRENEKRFRDLVEFLPIPIGEYGFDMTLKYANQKAIEFFGFNREDISSGVSLADLVPEDLTDLIQDRIRLLAAGQNPGPLEMSLRCKNGDLVWGKILPSIIYEKEKPVGVRTCFLDMTQRLKTEQEILEAAEQEKYALVGQVAGKMAHDFNNILSAIMGNAELTLLDCRDLEVSRVLEIILEQAKRGNRLTQNLVAFAKDQEIKEEYFNINAKVDLVLSLLKKDLEGITVIKNYQENLPDLLADPGMIEHALVNLIQNAIHAMGKTPNPVLALSTASGEKALSLVIQDNGCGIPEAYAKEIYSPSFTLKGSRDFARAYHPEIKGTGYGLSNVKKYIDKHRGRISFVSQEGKGTRFFISLPLVARALLPKEKKRLGQKPLARERRILVVEDEAAISSVLIRILSSDPFFHKVTLARTAEEAMDLLDKGGPDAFDLISLDYVLPGPASGLDVYTHLRRQRETLPVLFISGNIRFLQSVTAMKNSDPWVDHLPKPFENLVYADKVNDWLSMVQKPVLETI